MSATYFSTPTDLGNIKDANAKALGLPRRYTALAIGDGGGDNAPVPTPKPSQKALLGEWRRAPLNTLEVDPKNPSQLIAEQVIPENEGGKWIREMGLYDEDGDLCYVCNAPPTYKPLLAEGSGKTQSVRMVIINSTGVNVELKIDPSLILATREYADKSINAAMKAHTDAPDPHPMYLLKNDIGTIGMRFNGYWVVSEGKKLTSDYSGKFVNLAAGAPFTVELPLTSTMGAGEGIWFRNFGQTVTVVTQGDDVMTANGFNLKAITLLPGDSLEVVSSGKAYSIGGTAALSLSAQFAALVATNGFSRHVSGLIYQHFAGQWGNVSGRQTMTVSFPYAFPNALYGIVVGNSENGVVQDDATVQWVPRLSTLAVGGFYCGNVIANATGFMALAIGK